jgi:excisionase family DNA binding protein
VVNDDYQGPIEIYPTTGELMDMLSVSRSTVYRWRRKGLPHINIGFTHRFPKDQVLAWLKEKYG